MDPMTMYALAMLGSSAVSALTAPDAQELQSFAGDPNLDPRDMLNNATGNINDMLGVLKSRAAQPVNFRSAYVQQPGVITGGGMPMPIGLTGMDPALSDPSLLSLPGIQMPSSFGKRSSEGGEGSDVKGTALQGVKERFEALAPEDRPNWLRLSEDASTPSTTGPRRRNASATPPGTNTGTDNVSEYDDLPQATGAVELLLRSMQMGA